ncbi:2OG-Fe(II) oxygenase [Pelagibacterales bacterium SAG-MED28]|jgi:Rps23 Pro-64 3,4-dihydroxylase Tpa1-like proline 4-hydroxylase|nr:2OG-Fe(II) oxygenase [Pelagibacterales bacterium SAG-MED28]
MILEPRWKSYIVATNEAIFTPEQCDHIIRIGQSEDQAAAKIGTATQTEKNLDPTKIKDTGVNDSKKRITTISWLPFNRPDTILMYKKIDTLVRNINCNHFGFDGIQITEQAQYTEYPTGAFYEWHTDNDTDMRLQPPVRKISMTLLLSDEKDFEGGDLEMIDDAKRPKMKRGHAIFFASFVRHRVTPVTKGNRKSLVMWFGGPPFK